MAIVLVLVALAVIAALGICVALVVSVVLGILLAKTGTPRFIVAILLFVIPSGAIGAAAGAILIGRMAYGANQSAILLGPLAGLILGGFTGATMGAGAGMLWFRRKREDLPELPTES